MKTDKKSYSGLLKILLTSVFIISSFVFGLHYGKGVTTVKAAVWDCTANYDCYNCPGGLGGEAYCTCRGGTMVNGVCQNGCGSQPPNVPPGQEACMFLNWYGCAEWWTICPVNYSCINHDCVPNGNPTNPPSTITPTTTPVGSCLDVKAYTPAWVAHTTTTLSQLKAGNTLYFCARGSTNIGSFDMARFTINTILRPNTTVKRPNTVNEYCDLYTMPANIYRFNISAQIHHLTLGWIQ